MNNKLSPLATTLRIAACVFLSAASGRALAADSKVDMSDKSFMNDAAEGGIAEVNAGQAAQSKSSNPDVKAFGEHMVTDHTKANEELKALAATKSVELPTSPSLVQQAKAKLLDRKSGADFDSSYADLMVTDHKKTVKLFEKEASEGDDADVKAFASKTLPTLKMHLKMAEELKAKVGSK